MFYKSPRIWITGELFLPSKVIDVIGICFDDFFDFGSIENHKLQRKNSYGCGIIEVPSNIIFEKNNEDFDPRINWLLEYIKDKIPIIRQFGGENIQLDIEYNLDLGNRQQRYVDNLSVDQMALMSTLGISYEISIWVNDEEE